MTKAAKLPPREIADRVKAALEAAPPPHLDRVEIAGPGFVNFHLVAVVAARRAARGRRRRRPLRARPTRSHGQRINLEFVSANPTGPLHAGGGRWVAVGDALANLLAAQGAEVHREYYLNDAGTQLGTFRRLAATRATAGEEPPEDGYQGEYLVEMADAAARRARRRRRRRRARASGATATSSQGSRTTSAASACTSTPGSPSARCTSAATSTDVSTTSASAGVVYEHDGATWLRTTDFGDQRDRVLVAVRRRDHLPLQRPRLPPRQVRPRLHAPHRHLGRRPPRPGEVAAGRASRRSATRPASPRSCSASS